MTLWGVKWMGSIRLRDRRRPRIDLLRRFPQGKTMDGTAPAGAHVKIFPNTQKLKGRDKGY
jgi:hypothetical protein